MGSPAAHGMARRRRAPDASGCIRSSAWLTTNLYEAGVAVGAVAVGGMLLVLSLQHLATGVEAITGCSRVEALLLAVGIDLGLVVTECAAIVASPAAAR